MRIASKTFFDSITHNLSRISTDMYSANMKIASGKRIMRLSDDPVGLIQSLRIKTEQTHLDQMGTNISLGQSWLASAETALRGVNDLITDAKVLAIQMANASIGADERAAAAKVVDNIQAEIIALANADANGRYVFAGLQTTRPPFADDGTYQGDHQNFSVKIGRDADIEIGSDGSAVLGTLFDGLEELETALSADDVAGIQNSITTLDGHFDHITTEISNIGAKALRLEIRSQICQDLELTQTERLSAVEDTDVASAIVELQSMQLTYQAAMKAAGEIMNLSMVNFFK